MALISCRNAALAYDGKNVVEHLTFTVESGDYLCIVGENGAGKSTLIKGLLGLIKTHGGEIITGDGLKHTEIGYLPQQTAAQKDFPASVREVVLSGCLNRCKGAFYKKEDRQRAAANMERLGILPLKNACYRELSGGQQRRVLLARALCATQKLILLDEPAAGLDPLVTNDLYKLIQELNEKDGITVIMVSHDMEAAVKYAKHILHLSSGGAFFGTVEEYRSSTAGISFMGGHSHV